MRTRPDAGELLTIAEATLTGTVVPELGPRQRYNAALIAAAMGIARREIAGGPAAWPRELDALQALYGEEPGEPPATALPRLNRRFATDLRAGAFDAPGDKRRKAAVELLVNDVLARLAEDSPRYRK